MSWLTEGALPVIPATAGLALIQHLELLDNWEMSRGVFPNSPDTLLKVG